MSKRRRKKTTRSKFLKDLHQSSLTPKPDSLNGHVSWKYLLLLLLFIPFSAQIFNISHRFQIFLCAWAAICVTMYFFLTIKAKEQLLKSVQPGNILIFQVCVFTLSIISYGFLYFFVMQLAPAEYIQNSSLKALGIGDFVYFAFQLILGIGDKDIVPNGSIVKFLILMQEYLIAISVIQLLPLSVYDRICEYRGSIIPDPLAPKSPPISLSTETTGMPTIYRVFFESALPPQGQGDAGIQWSPWFLVPLTAAFFPLFIESYGSRHIAWGIFVLILFCCGLTVFLMSEYHQFMRVRFHPQEHLRLQFLLWLTLGVLFADMHRVYGMLDSTAYVFPDSPVSVFDYLLLGFPTVFPAGFSQIRVADLASKFIVIFEGIVALWFGIGIAAPLVGDQVERLQKWRKYQRIFLNLATRQ